MMLFDKSIRSFCRLTGKMVTLVFALFCVAAGLFDEVSAASVTGTVRNRVDNTAIGFIQVVMSDMMCPLYGIGLPCIQGRALDTAETGTDGQFVLQNSDYSGLFFTLTDPDSALPGGFKTRILSKYVTGTSAGALYILPKNGTYTVKGSVLSAKDSLPIKGIKADLAGVITSTGGIISTSYERVVASAYSDQAGQVTFSLDSVVNTARINVTDVDSTANRGTFISASSGYFNAFDSLATMRIYMWMYSTSVASGSSYNVQTTPITPALKNGIVEFIVPRWQGVGHYEAVVLDSRGAVVARPSLSPSGLIRWDARGVSRGVYFVKVLAGQSAPGVRIFLP